MPSRAAFAAFVIVTAVLATGPARAGGSEGKADKPDKGSFVTIDTLTAAVLAPNGRRQVMTVQCGVDVPNAALHAYAEMVQPRLRDAYTQTLQIYAGALSAGSPPDPDYLGRRLQEATDRVLGKPGGRFLFGGIMIN